MIEVVSATRSTAAQFHNSALGVSLRRLGFDERIRPEIAFENSRGLPEVYNARIEADSAHDALVFVHDDVWLNDLYFGDHLLQGLETWDVVGVAGTRRPAEGLPSWGFHFAGESVEGSGRVAHGRDSFSPVALFGPAPAECQLMDGVFLAARRSTLSAHGVRFDDRFDFHFYDLDFCRQATQAGLKIGTWRLNVTHQSRGQYRSPSWHKNHELYQAKWGPSRPHGPKPATL